jgi:hypothetical protein
MTATAIARHFEAIRTIDARAEREERKIRERLAFQEKKHKANHWSPALKAAAALEGHIRNRLKPHRAEFVHTEAWHIDHRDMSVHPSFSFEVWPHKPGAIRFATQARTPIKASVTPRTEAEFLFALAGIKEAADRLADMLYTLPPGIRRIAGETIIDKVEKPE